MQSGAVYGFTSLVDGMCERFRDEFGPVTVVATGGLATLIAPLSRSIEARRALAHPARAPSHLRTQPEQAGLSDPDPRTAPPTT